MRSAWRPTARSTSRRCCRSDDAPVEAIRALLAAHAGAGRARRCRRSCVRLGTTVATNALLERRGVPTLLVDQSRARRPPRRSARRSGPICSRSRSASRRRSDARVLELAGRARAGRPRARAARRARRARGARGGARARASARSAIVAHPCLRATRALEARARGARARGRLRVRRGVRARSRASSGLLARGETTRGRRVPHAAAARARRRAARGAARRARSASCSRRGGLTDAARFRGPERAALGSGRRRGRRGARRARRPASRDAIGFDMGGTSTDVSLLRDGEPERTFETARSRACACARRCCASTPSRPAAARSAASTACALSGRAGERGRACRARSATAKRRADGAAARARAHRREPAARPRAARPLPVSARARAGGARARRASPRRSRAAGHERGARGGRGRLRRDRERAHGAGDRARCRCARGVDPRDSALVGFGGAAGQHVCAVARRLGIRTMLLHPLAGVLSAYGIGVAGARAGTAQRDAGRARSTRGAARCRTRSRRCSRRSSAEGRARARGRGRRGATALRASARARPALPRHRDGARRRRAGRTATGPRAFARARTARASATTRPGRAIEVGRPRACACCAPSRRPEPRHRQATSAQRPRARRDRAARARLVPEAAARDVPVYWREDLAPGRARSRGPALVLEATGTIVVEPGFVAELRRATGAARAVTDEAQAQPAPRRAARRDDPVRLEVMGSRFMSIAEQMGAVLRNTAVSTNISERLDYSCAVFDATAGWSRTRRTSPCTSARWARRCARVRAALPRPRARRRVRHQRPGAGRLAPAGRHRGHARVRRRTAQRCASSSRAAATTPTSAASTPGLDAAVSRTLEEEGVLLAPHARSCATGASTRRACARALARRALPGAQSRRQRRGPRGADRREPRGRAAARRAGRGAGRRAGRGHDGGSSRRAAGGAGARARSRRLPRRRAHASPTRSTTARRSRVRLAVEGERLRDRLRRHGRRGAGQPERAARGGARRRDLRAARARGRAHPAERRLPRAGRAARAAGLAARPAARRARSSAATSRPRSAWSTCCSARSAARPRARAR